MNEQEQTKIMRIVFADDEQPAREKLNQQLSLIPNIEVVGFATTGKEAITLINDEQPDLVLLDIQMPEINGMDLLSLLTHKPMVIFTTAYDQYAIAAFEQASTDYLLKPFPLARLKSAIDKAYTAFLQKEALQVHSEPVKSPQQPIERLISKSGERMVILSPDDIFYIKSDQGNSFAFNGDKQHFLNETLDQLELSLGSSQYVRIHRSYLVNIDKIKEIQRWFNGKLMVIMTDEDKSELSTSRTGADKLKQVLGL